MNKLFEIFRIILIVIAAIAIFISAMIMLIVAAIYFFIGWVLGLPVSIKITHDNVTEKRTYRWNKCIKVVRDK